MKQQEIYPIEKRPKLLAPDGEGWSVDIILISGKKERVGYYDPKGSIAGGKYFYYENDMIEDCANLIIERTDKSGKRIRDFKNFPTHWRYKEPHKL